MGRLGASWGVLEGLGPSLGRLGGDLGRLGCVLGASWGVLRSLGAMDKLTFLRLGVLVVPLERNTVRVLCWDN